MIGIQCAFHSDKREVITLTSPVDPVRPSKRRVRVIATIVALAALVAIVLLATYGYRSDNTATSSATASPVPSASASTSASPTPTGNGCDLGKAFQVWARDTVVEHDKGVTFNGTACLKDGEKVFAFDYDPGDKLYYLDDRWETVEIVSVSGAWDWTNAPIGHEGDSNNLQVVTFVLADARCADHITGQSENEDGDVVMNGANLRKEGCKIVTEVDVYVTD